VEVLLHAKDERLVVRNALDFVSPLPRNFDCGLHGLGAGVHWQDHVEAEELCDELGESWEDIVIECSAAQCQPRGLLGQCFDKLWVAMALIDCTVCREEVEVVFPFL
jgi:hypothetical protein